MHAKPMFQARLLPLLLFFFFQQFTSAQSPANLPVPCRKGVVWGLADPADGRVLLAPSLDSIGSFQCEHGDCPLAWAKKGGLFGLINRLGEVVLPFAEHGPTKISPLTGGYFSAEKLAFGAKSEEEEAEKAGETYTAFRPIAFFDSMGRVIGRPFEFETYVSFEGGDCGYDGFYDPSETGENTEGFYSEKNQFTAVWKNGETGLFDLISGQILIAPRWKTFQLLGPNVAIGWLGDGLQFEKKPADSLFIINLAGGEKAAAWPSGLEFSNQYSSFSEDRFLAKDPATGLFGYIDRAGKVAIPFVFKEARTFSRGGLAMAQRGNGSWHIIDGAGRDSVELGPEPGVLRGPDGIFWTKKAGDGLFRKTGAEASDPVVSFGFDQLPQKVQLGGKDFWQGSRHGLSGLLNLDGSVALPFEYGHARPAEEGSRRDSALHAAYFAVFFKKANLRWLFDSRTMQPVRPMVLPESGLLIGQNLAESNFQLIAPLVGDSLFTIETGQRVMDILNIRTGQRWFLKNKPSRVWVDDGSPKMPRIYSQLADGSSPSFSPDVRPSSPNGASEAPVQPNSFSFDFGYWGHFFDEKSGLTTITDASGMPFCSILVPFEGEGNSLSIEKNRGGTAHQFVVMASSPDRRTAIFSLAGKLLSPPYIYKATVSHDLIFAEMYQKKGAFRLADGKEILPCAYRDVYFEDGKICAIDTEGTESRFDLRGEKLFSFEKGMATWGKPSEGLQLVKKNGRFGFLDETRQPVFWLAEGLRPWLFSDGLSGVTNCETDEQFFINKKGERLFGDRFRRVGVFENGRAIVQAAGTGDWQLIDTSGKKILVQPKANGGVIWRLKNGLFAKVSSNLKTIADRNGREILTGCDRFEERGDSIFFQQKGKFGHLLPDGSVVEIIRPSERVVQKTPFGEVVEAESLDNGQGFRATDGRWLVDLKPNRHVHAADGFEQFIHIVDFENGAQTQSFLDSRTGQKVDIGPFDSWAIIEGLGWLFQKNDENGDRATAFLCSPDFSEKKAVPFNWRIEKDWGAGCFSVTDYSSGDFLGHIARNGKVLFED